MSVASQNQLREMNEALLVSAVHQHELTEQAERAAASLQQRQTELRAGNEALEQRVGERTAALLGYQQRLRALVKELGSAEIRERKRVALELHDNLVQLLAVCKMKVAAIETSSPPGSPSAAHALAVKQFLGQGMEYARTLMSDLRPDVLNDFDLEAAVRWVGQRMEQHGLLVRVEDDGAPKPLEEELVALIFDSVRELLFNVIKHAGTNQATVSLRRAESAVRVTVSDAGAGFDPLHQAAAPSEQGGFGLFSISERLSLIGGRTEVESAPSRGTAVTLIVPLRSPSGADAERLPSQAKADPMRGDFPGQLREMNDALLASSVRQHELTEQAEKAEAALRVSEQSLSDELDSTRLLQQVSTRLIREGDVETLYQVILDAAAAIMHSDFASFQLFHPERGDAGELRLLGYRGFDPEAAKFWEWVRPMATTTCGRAVSTGQRCIVADVEKCDWMAGSENLATYRRTGIRAVQSTPLVSRTGAVLGMISTHWRQPHQPLDRDLGLIDVLARQAADLIERKAAEESSARLAAIVESSDDAIISKNLNGIITSWNSGAQRLFGYAPKEIIGKPVTVLIPPDHADEEPGILERIRRGQRVENYDTVRQGKDGSRIHVSLTVSPIKDAAGRVIGAAKIARDITDRKQTENGLKTAREHAEAANAAKDRFLAVLSHELRTPLTPVMMSITAMDMNPDLAPEIRDDVTMIRRNVELEARLIDDLLDLSRVTSGKLRLNLEAVDWNQAVRDACQTCRPQVLEKGIHLHCDLSDACGHARADSARLQQVLWNLIRNAAKFTPEGGNIYITTACNETGTVQVQVRDTGIGIAPDLLPRIFDAFEQGDADITRRFGGMGLGLAISKALVEVHHGTIRAASAGPDAGSTFTVEFPAMTVEELAQSGRPKSDRSNIKGNSLRVLLVEDHADTAHVLSRLLRSSGHVVKTAGTVAAALELAGKEPFDVLVSDLGLPDATGYELMRQITARYPMKGVAMSGYGMDEDLHKSREAGFSDHIVKPVNVAQLERAIRRVAGLSAES